MQEGEFQQTRLKGWEMVLGSILYPSEALPDIAKQRPWDAAIGLLLIMSILSYGMDSLMPSGNKFSLSGMIWNILYGMLSFVVFVSLVNVIGQQWYNAGDYGGAFCALAFTSTPFFFFALISILIIPFGIQPPTMNPLSWAWQPRFDPAAAIFILLLALATLIWILILSVIAIREHYDLTNGQAIITVILAVVVHSVIFWVLGGIFK